jgi:hypothetical protein
MIASASERLNEGLTGTGKDPEGAASRGRLIPLRAMARRGVQLRAKFALSSSRLDSRSLHVANSEAQPPPAPPPHMHCCASLTIGLVVAGAGIVEAHPARSHTVTPIPHGRPFRQRGRGRPCATGRTPRSRRLSSVRPGAVPGGSGLAGRCSWPGSPRPPPRSAPWVLHPLSSSWLPSQIILA